MIRRATRFEAALSRALPCAVLALVCACGRTEPARFATTTGFDPDAGRRPAGVAVDPATELPKPVRVAQADDGVVVLQPPSDLKAASDVIRAFFRAVVDENIALLESVLDEQASLQLDAQSGRRRARDYWRLRLTQLDYQQLASKTIYKDSDVEWYRSEDMPRLARRGQPALELVEGDVVLRVPIATPKLNKERLFGDEIVFVLRPSATTFRITEMIEPFQMN
jgi:hypothetical protein